MEFAQSIEDLKDKAGDVYAENVEIFTAPPVPFDADNVYGKKNTVKDSLFANLQRAIADGHVKTSQRTVSFDVKDGKTIVKQYRQSYTKCTAVDATGVLALPGIDGIAETSYKFVSERADAGQYQPVYVGLRNAGQGPEKTIEKLGKFLDGLTAEQIALVKAQLAGV